MALDVWVANILAQFVTKKVVGAIINHSRRSTPVAISSAIMACICLDLDFPNPVNKDRFEEVTDALHLFEDKGFESITFGAFMEMIREVKIKGISENDFWEGIRIIEGDYDDD